ncbi:MAG: TetR/AcrR family transcriptional regulator [Deinococcota bacterium]
MTKKSYHHGDVRQAALDAVLEMLDTGEANKLSLRTIAQRIGVSHHALYRHFDNLEDLLGEVVSICLTHLNGLLGQAIEQGDDLEQRVCFGCTAYLEHATNYPARYELMFAPNTPMASHEKAWQAGETAFSMLIALAAEADASEPALLAFQVWTTLHGTVELLKHIALPAGLGDKREALLSQTVEACTQVFLRVANA